MDLTNKKCVPCENGGEPFDAETIHTYLADTPGWHVIDGKKIVREFEFKDFVRAISFVNKVADIAETEGHHPDIHINYNKVKLELWTHAVGGLMENDFIVAAKINKMEA
ncbi:MAG: 4a-hydroxytetrahydrobiopterin dehydratase [Patescibacteria group bacterium]